MTNPRTVVVVCGIVAVLASACDSSAGDDASASADAATGDPSVDAGDLSSDAGPRVDAGGGDCVPVSDDELVCDGIDDDCNGIIDDVDIGDDGFCDCYTIGIIGNPGVNPSADFDAWLNLTGTEVTRIGGDASHVLTADQLVPFDIVILDRLTHAYSEAEAAILGAYVEAGHGLITMAGYTNSATDRENQSSLTRAVGLQLVAPIYLDPTEVWNAHPITAGADAVQFYGGWVVEAVGAQPLGEILLTAASDAATLAVAKEHGTGRAFIYGDEWISFDSEWQAIPGVTTLWQNVIRWVGPKDECFPIVQ